MYKKLSIFLKLSFITPKTCIVELIIPNRKKVSRGKICEHFYEWNNSVYFESHIVS